MITILESTEYPIAQMGKMAGICWGADISTHTANFTRGKECIESGHGRVMEYSDVILEISEYSARMIRELYTHIQGVSRLQESTRYVDCGNFSYYVPDSIKNNPQALSNYEVTMSMIQSSYQFLENELKIPKQDIANILPLAMHTSIVLKINCRALIHMAEIRMCTRALKEYRDFMKELIKVLSDINTEWKAFCDNYMKPKCEWLGYCNEKHSCGKYPSQ